MPVSPIDPLEVIETIGEVAGAIVTVFANVYNALALGAAAEPECFPDPDSPGVICMELQLGMMPIGPRGFAVRGPRLLPKAINLPAWRKISIDTAHIAERHMVGGALTAGRTVFPAGMSQSAVERAIRQAYRYGERIGGQGDRILIRGTHDGLTIEMWVNRATKTIETAYPVF